MSVNGFHHDPAPIRILRVDSSGRYGDSLSRRLTGRLTDALTRQHPDATVVDRDVAQGVPFLTETTIAASFTPPADRHPGQAQALSTSDHLVAELLAADYLVIGAPIYNFSVPATLKAYFDQVARAGVTFSYSPEGPTGLVTRVRTAYVVLTSNGVRLGSEADHASAFIRQFLGFLGITDVRFVDGTGLLFGGHGHEEQLTATVDGLVPVAA
ncbi:NAD(P)H-dependent oxidoreductase [Micromonospora sp. R77]|uniref:FMN-dependent NADH-azoreductase n=1 Tax=Micromonospora sp. R77 TaxID=2925836 RepID=UPI001F612686|nr:NAD(P)H-dependent oxidoreductase [Micromonospora sp. R77]MCI4067019.1 NAD(P)H-dependent oxidoreductase [Micromonospora sp. R77]